MKRVAKLARTVRTTLLGAAASAVLVTSASAATIVEAERNRNLVLLDSFVFVLGVVLLGSVCVYWGRRIFLDK